MLVPKKQKHRKHFRRRSSLVGVASNGHKIAFGEIGLKAVTAGEITSRQIEAARRAITRYIKRGGKVWIIIFPHKPVTRKGAEVPMGSGKGTPEFYIFPTLPGKVLFELSGVAEDVAREALRLGASKLPVKCKVVISQH